MIASNEIGDEKARAPTPPVRRGVSERKRGLPMIWICRRKYQEILTPVSRSCRLPLEE